MNHVIWDWNGTLFDDLDIVVRSVNATLRALGAGPIVADDYRDHYTRPVRIFYDRLLGRRVSADEWTAIDRDFHDSYRSLLAHGALAVGADEALSAVRSSGATQSILSMWWHDELVPMTEGLGVDAFMVRIDGNRGDATGETKAVHLERHLLDLRSDGILSEPVVVGDSLDDARAASAVGVKAVLYDGGSHHRHELEAAGVPVAGSLVEAVELSGIV